jgi:predicted transposase YdaD
MKETLKDAIDALIVRVLAIPVTKTVSLNTDLPITDERRPDFIIRVDEIQEYTNPSETKKTPFIIHLEFQTANDPVMHLRMLRYRSYLAVTYKLPVRQFVIFVGNDPLCMKNLIIDEEMSFRYTIIDMRDIDSELFLHSDNPEEIVLSILCRPIDDNRKLTIHLLLDNLKHKVYGELAFGKYTRQLKILSRLRKAQEMIKEEMETMAITFDINDDPYYQDGMNQGIILGLKQNRLETARKMKEKGIDQAVISEITGLSAEEIEKVVNNE